MTKYVRVLTEEHNDYYQHGEYFLAVFAKEPLEKDLIGFGYNHFDRNKNESQWVNKKKVEVND